MALKQRFLVASLLVTLSVLFIGLPTRGQGVKPGNVDELEILIPDPGKTPDIRILTGFIGGGSPSLEENFKVSSADIRISRGAKPGTVDVRFKYRNVLTGEERTLLFTVNTCPASVSPTPGAAPGDKGKGADDKGAGY